MNNKAAEEAHMEECLERDVLLMGSLGQFCCTGVGWESYLRKSYRTRVHTRGQQLIKRRTPGASRRLGLRPLSYDSFSKRNKKKKESLLRREER